MSNLGEKKRRTRSIILQSHKERAFLMIRWRIGFLKLILCAVWSERKKLEFHYKLFEISKGLIGKDVINSKYLFLKQIQESLQGLILEARNVK